MMGSRRSRRVSWAAGANLCKLAQAQMIPCLRALNHRSQPTITKLTYLKSLLLGGDAHHRYCIILIGLLSLEKKVWRSAYRMRECLEHLKLYIHGHQTFLQSRGINYYKSLIHQHGGERQEPLQQHGMQFGMHHHSVPSQTSTIDVVSNGTMPGRETKHRPTKPCAYFNSARGCRNGANCTFLHDVSAARKEQPKGSKRIKLDSRIAGRY